jgi:hypothetical protein
MDTPSTSNPSSSLARSAARTAASASPGPAATTTAATDAAAPASLLLALPAALLAPTFEYLTPRELMRTLTLTTKHPALSRFADHEHMEAVGLSFWTHALRRFLPQFMPARDEGD